MVKNSWVPVGVAKDSVSEELYVVLLNAYVHVSLFFSRKIVQIQAFHDQAKKCSVFVRVETTMCAFGL